MLISYTLFIIAYLMVITYFGLYIGNKIENPMKYKIYWAVYIIVNIALLNSVMLANFWGVLQKKTGPPGPMGMKGTQGKTGDSGICDEICKNNECIKELTDTINKIYADVSGNKDAVVKNKELLVHVKKMCNSKEYEIMVEIKGVKNLIDYISGIWKEWVKNIYDKGVYGNNNYLEDLYAKPVSFNWKNGINPFIDIEKYDIYHWGLSQEFRSIGIGVCQDASLSNYFPENDKHPFELIETNNYREVYTFSYQGVQESISIWEPKKLIYNKEKYYPLSQVIISPNGNLPIVNQDITNKFCKIRNKTILNYSIAKAKIGNKKVSLFSRQNYSGFKKDFTASRYSNVNSVGFDNRRITSLKIPDGYSVKLFTDINFNGNSVEIIGPKNISTISAYHNLQDINNNNIPTVKSFIVEYSSLGNGPPKTSYIITGSLLEKPIDYEKIWDNNHITGIIFRENISPNKYGYSVAINEPGFYSAGYGIAAAIRGDTLSEIIVPRGYKIILWEHWGEGDFYISTGPIVLNLVNIGMNDRVSSFKILIEGETDPLVSIWRPIAPRGYAFISDVCIQGLEKPSLIDPPIVALPKEYLTIHSGKREEMPEFAGSVSQYPWSDRKKGWVHKVKTDLEGGYCNSYFPPQTYGYIPNDAINGIKVNSGFKITLYQHFLENFMIDASYGTGIKHTYGPGIHNFIGDQGLSNTVTGIKVEYDNGTIDITAPKLLFSTRNFPFNLSENQKLSILGYDGNYEGSIASNKDVNVLSNCFIAENDEYGAGLPSQYKRDNNIPASINIYKLNINKLIKKKRYNKVRELDLERLIKQKENIEAEAEVGDNVKIDSISGMINSKSGIGWHGLPLREPKHSIFSYLGMAPEGIITHRASERKYYITHSGIMKEEKKNGKKRTVPENSYFVLVNNINTNKYDMALTVNSNSDKIKRILVKSDINQLWKVDFVDNSNMSEFRLKSMGTEKYLSIKPKNDLRGRSIESQTIYKDADDNINNTTIFTNFKSAYGPSINVIRNSDSEVEDEHNINATPLRFIKSSYVDPVN